MRGRHFIEPVLLSGLVVALLLPGITFGPSDDAATFTLLGHGLLNGHPPYSGVWDHKPPGMALFAALAQSLLPFLSSWHAVWVASALAIWGSAWLTGLLLEDRATANHRAVARVVCAAVLSAFPMASGGGLTESVAVLPAVSAVLLARKTNASPVAAALSGALAAVAAITSVQAISVLAPVALLLGLRTRPMRSLILSLAGFAGVALAATAWLAGIGALPAALDALVRYNGIYVSLPAGMTDLQLILQVGSLAALVLLLVPAMAAGRDGRRASNAPVNLVWLGSGLLLFLAEGRPYAHFLALTIPPAVVLAVPGLTLMPIAPRLRLAWALGAALLAATSVLLLPRDASLTSAAAAEIRQEAASSDASVFVWGVEPQLYLDADVALATRYVYCYPLTTPGYWTADAMDQFVQELRASPPSLIVDASSPDGLAGYVPLLEPHAVFVDRQRDLDVAQPLRDLVAKMYRESARIGGYIVYRLEEPLTVPTSESGKNARAG